jgi:small subunit ribosomal protein S17
MAKSKTGIVTAHHTEKTAIVRIDRMVPHPKYGKRYRVSKKFAVHDEQNEAKTGDIVTIEETRPISKTKNWKIVSITPTTVLEETIETVKPSPKKKAK